VSQPWETCAGADALPRHGGCPSPLLRMPLCPGHHSMNPPPTGEITNHGGLTGAALENVRLCSANVVFRREIRCVLRLPFSPAKRHCATRSGERKPPVEHTPHTSSKRRNSSDCTCRCDSKSHGGLTNAALAKVRVRSENIADLYGDKRNTSGCKWRQPRHKSQSCTSGKVSLASVAPRVAMIVRFRQVATPVLAFGPGVVGGAESQCSFASGKLQRPSSPSGRGS
jgi:hypothetical protein